MAFDVSEDFKRDKLNGGCLADEVTAVETAFTETLEMVSLIQTAVSNLKDGTEPPAVGWMFNALFGIQATEELNDRGIARPQTQTDALMKIQNLMDKIVAHSTGKFVAKNLNGLDVKARIFCIEDWIVTTSRRMSPKTKVASPIVYFLSENAPGVPPQEHWYDVGEDIYLVPVTELWEPKKRFRRLATVGTMQAPLTTTFPGIPPDSLDKFNIISMTLLHEYTHLIGRIAFGDADKPIPKPLPDVNLFPEHYQFANAAQMLRISGTDIALRNADSYTLLGVALKLGNCDWRDGACRSPTYWERLRQQILKDARTLLGLRFSARGHKK
ncbi:hypothetical protein IFR05_004870 [Cadophora sp. M221]|nr:hypothetical protein IFR05_004870 [Cadophora sp. M221]